MSVYYILGFVSALVFISSYIPYVISILKGDTKPHPFSWLLWVIIGSINLFFYIRVGAHETLPLAYCNALFPAIVFFLSIKYWKGGFSIFDYVVLFLSIVSIILYIMFHSADISLTIGVIADIFAFLPTIRKTYIDPSSENMFGWVLFMISYILSVFAISHWTYGVAIYPCYLATFGALMCILILRGKIGGLKKP